VWGVVLLRDSSPSNLPVMRFWACFPYGADHPTAWTRCGFCTSKAVLEPGLETTAAATPSVGASDAASTSLLVGGLFFSLPICFCIISNGQWDPWMTVVTSHQGKVPQWLSATLYVKLLSLLTPCLDARIGIPIRVL
jgi:hypothetical protein